MDQFGPGSMTSTHTGNPVCVAAALASVKKIIDDKLTENAANLGPILETGLRALQKKHQRYHWARHGDGFGGWGADCEARKRNVAEPRIKNPITTSPTPLSKSAFIKGCCFSHRSARGDKP